MREKIQQKIDDLVSQSIELYQQGQHERAIDIATQVCDLVRKELGENHPYFATSLVNLAELYRGVENYAAAEPLLRQALAIRQKVLGPTDPDVTQIIGKLAYLYQTMGTYALSNLAGLYQLQSDDAIAEMLYQHSLEIARTVLGESHPDVAKSLDRLAALYSARGNYAAAEPLYRQASDTLRAALGENHPAFAASLINLGTVYYKMGNYAAAEPLYRQALEILRTALGESNPDVVQSLIYLAELYRAIGDYTAAEPLYRQAQEIGRTVFEENNQAFAVILNGLAELHLAKGDYAGAESLYRQLLEVERTRLGEHHEEFAKVQGKLAELYRKMGDYPKAEPLYRQSLQILRTALGDEHPDVATGQANLALLYQAMGRYTDAEPLFQQALEIDRRTLGEKHPEFATSLNNLAGLYYSRGNYIEAERLFQQALEVKRAALGEGHVDVANILENLAGVYLATGRPALAEEFTRRSMQIKRVALGEDHPDMAITLGNMASLYQVMGRYSEAEALLQQALAIIRKTLGERHPDFAFMLGRMADLLQAMGDYAAAEPLFKQAVEIMRDAVGAHHPDYARCIYHQADLYLALRYYAVAEPLCRKALQIRGSIFEKTHPDVTASLNQLGTLYYEMGNYAAAEPLYEQALEGRRAVQGESHPAVAESLNNLAELYREIGNYTEAERLDRQALEIRRKVLGEHHPDVATSLNNLALLYTAMGNYAAAEPLLQEALEVRRSLLGVRHPLIAHSLGNLAELYRMMGNYQAAEPLYKEALELSQTVYGETHPDVAIGLNNLALLYDTMGNYAAAEPLFRQALEVQRRTLGEIHPSFAITLANLSAACAAVGKEAEALAFIQEAIAIDDRMIGQIFSIGSERQRMAYLKVLRGNFYDALSLILVNFADKPSAVQAALELIWRRKTIGAEALAAQRDAVLGGQHPALAQKLHEWTILRMQIAQKTLGGPGPEGLEAHQQRLVEWNIQKDRLEEELARQIPEMNLEKRLRTADRQTIAGALPTGAALVEFVRFLVFDIQPVHARGNAKWLPARYLAFVLHAGAPDNVQLVDLGEAEPIDRTISLFRTSIMRGADQSGRDLRELTELELPDNPPDTTTGTTLRGMVFDPLVKTIDNCTRLFLAPDGDLNRLPFEVLPIGDGHRLIDVHRISYLGVGRDVLRFGAESAGQVTNPLVAADPNFDLGSNGAPTSEKAERSLGRYSRDLNRSDLHFSRLPGTRLEGEQIAKMLGVQPMLGDTVLETRIKACQSPHILHIATHGFFLPNPKRGLISEQPGLEAIGVEKDEVFSRLSGTGLENPLLRSGVALAGANTWLHAKPLPVEAEDGILTAEDVSGLDLQATVLVVLSACDTGLGEIQSDEGVFGLRRAFVLAGAQTLVMSLWKVPDQQTEELMVDFYRRILEGQPRADALRDAQLAMKTKYPNVLYWGAFICQGNPGPLVLAT